MKPYLSLIIPVHNERENIRPLAEEISSAVKNLGKTVEVIWVDDGSTDGSFDEIQAQVRSNPMMKGIRLGRNCGQTAALAAGIGASCGRYIAPMDADMQNDPADIVHLAKKIEEGFDVVSGWRKNRKDPWITRRLPSLAANFLISTVTGIRLHDYGCTLKIYRREYLQSIRLYGEMHRFLPAFAGFMGARITEMEVNHRPRIHGRSKYGLSRTFKVMLDLLTVKFMEQYLSKPIYLFGGWGFGFGAAAMLGAGITLYNKFHHGIFVKDQPLFLVSIFLGLIGIQLILLGLLAEIVVRTYYEINNRPPYFVKEKIGFEADTN